jgi:glucosamine--fructose-6-phosphate aminotransferase (isomerizing)
MTAHKGSPMTDMAREIAEIPAATKSLLAQFDEIAAIAERIRLSKRQFVVICGRGSSGHVGVYLRYLFETRLGLLVSAAAPSVVTAYRRPSDMRHVIFIVISQSGRSPDLVTATRLAREFGALTIALVNDVKSPVADEAELVLPVRAGPELAVAATKTVALSMVAGAQLIAALTGDQDLTQALDRLPQRMTAALACDWSAWSERLQAAPAAFVIGRGYGFGPVREIALKLTEAMQIPALGYSAAELRHGPRAAVTPATPVLVLRQNDEAAATVDDLIRDLTKEKETVFAAGGPAGTLPWIGDDHPICDPIAMLLPAYIAIERATRQRGLDPDKPRYLSKVTRTM